MNDFVFSSSFNLANMTCQLVELGSINPLKPISTSWNIEIAKLKLLSLRLGCFLASLQYPRYIVESGKEFCNRGRGLSA